MEPFAFGQSEIDWNIDMVVVESVREFPSRSIDRQDRHCGESLRHPGEAYA